MVFNALWTILLGVVGGIVSSLIVSRVFFIQEEYQRQFKYVNGIIRKMGSISAWLQSIKAIFKVSYDQDVKIEREMKEKGYRSEMEYYAAHSEVDWISKNDVLEVFRKEIARTAKSIQDDVTNNPVEDTQLNKIVRDILTYVHDVSSTKDYTFSSINQFEVKEKDILEKYDACQKLSGRKLIKQVFKDKIMIILFIIVVFLIVGTILSFTLGI